MKYFNKTALLLAVCWSALLVVGCTSEGATDVGGSGGSAELKIITLQDGTKCAAIVGYSKAAIDCNWGDH